MNRTKFAKLLFLHNSLADSELGDSELGDSELGDSELGISGSPIGSASRRC
jgi:hypothetical protein